MNYSHALNKPDGRATNLTRSRYERLAPFFDLMQQTPEKRFIPWRKSLWSLVNGSKILEVGVGTGKNLPYYPLGAEVTAIDLTPGMLKRAQKLADKLRLKVDLQIGDVQELNFRDSSFETAVASFVFCSVPDPILGFKELRRVVKPGGRILLLEHMLSSNHTIAKVMDLINPLVVRLMGANINRKTIENILRAGLTIERIEELDNQGIFKLILARVP